MLKSGEPFNELRKLMTLFYLALMQACYHLFSGMHAVTKHI
jgi:hypothetical protein